MSSNLIESLRAIVEEDLDGVTLTPDGLRAEADTRYGEVTVRVDHDEEAAALRVQVELPVPAGSGPEFLIWCLSTNVQYWDVKVGLDDTGLLAVHADLEVDVEEADAALATAVVDRVESILQLLDEDLVDYLLASGLGTPGQRQRWQRRRPEDEVDDDEDED
ncbi:MAG: hypothetical protein ACFCGT_10530 [Sandaracinaceae bacterium]